MYTLLLLAVLLLFLLEPAAAASPIMGYPLSAAPMEPFYSDAESVLNPICQYCAIPFHQCIHALVRPCTLCFRVTTLTRHM
jgi:hypothetical protein